MTKKLILDLDTGIDDALAIAYALGSPEAELVGVTAAYGNVLMEDSVRNSLAVLDILGADSVPVHPGLPHASTAEDFAVQEISTFIHGRNGLGEADIAPSTRSAAATDAVDFLIEASRQYGEELVYVPTGPLTNLAAALDQDPGLVERLDVVLMGTYSRLGLMRRPGRRERRRCREALDAVGLSELASRRFGTLSGGQRQRVLVARCIAAEPRLILLDEPFNGLDQPNRDSLVSIVRQATADGVGVVVSTHDLALAHLTCARACLLSGRQIAFGPVDEVLTEGLLAQAYGAGNDALTGAVP